MDLFSFLHTTKKAIPYLTDIKNQNYKLKYKNKYCKIVLKTPKNDLKFKYQLINYNHVSNDYSNRFIFNHNINKNINKSFYELSVYDISTIDLKTADYLNFIIPKIYNCYLKNYNLQTLKDPDVINFIKNIENYEYFEIINFIELMFNVKYAIISSENKIKKRFIDNRFYKINSFNIKICINPINEKYYTTDKNFIIFLPVIMI